MTQPDDLTTHIAALRARVPRIATKVYGYLHTEMWDGWKPNHVGEVAALINSHLTRIVSSRTNYTSSGGITVRVEYEGGEQRVSVAFEDEWTAMIDPFEGGEAFVIPDE